METISRVGRVMVSNSFLTIVWNYMGREDIPPIESEDEVSWDVEADVHIVKAKSSEVVLYHLRRLTTGITPFVTYR